MLALSYVEDYRCPGCQGHLPVTTSGAKTIARNVIVTDAPKCWDCELIAKEYKALHEPHAHTKEGQRGECSCAGKLIYIAGRRPAIAELT